MRQKIMAGDDKLYKDHLLPFLKSVSSPEKVASIMAASLNAVDPFTAVHRVVKRRDDLIIAGQETYDLRAYKNVYIIGVGKGVYAMAQALSEILEGQVKGGVVILKHIPEDVNSRLIQEIQFVKGAHPVPDENSVKSSQTLADFVKGMDERDLVFCVITGGGSSLMTLPVKNISLAHIQQTTKILLECGAEIQEINTIRKHLEQLKGGGLARLIYPATMITLILSDVIGNPMDVIASGPTVADETTFQDALAILHEYQIEDKVPHGVVNYLEEGASGGARETVKAGDPSLDRVQNLVVGDNFMAAQSAYQAAIENGFNSMILTTSLHGEAREVGKFLASVLKQTGKPAFPLQTPACIIVGGETTVTIHGSGKGGRNMETALGAVSDLKGLEKVALITLATDGEDGPTDAAGAIVTGHTYYQGKKLGLDLQAYLNSNDSYHYFEALEALIKIGPTGTNVNDLVFLFAF
jgi:glycerate 2-kinase